MMYFVLANLYLCVFYGFYHFFLRRETFFQINRAYLLAGLALAFTLPLAEYGGFDGGAIYHYQLPALQLGRASATQSMTGKGVTDVFGSLVPVIYVLGCLVMATLVAVRAWRTAAALGSGAKGQAFSFFGMVRIDRSTFDSAEVAHHEKVHMQEWHSADVVIMQVVKIFHWFNPLVYAYERALRLQHEYIADRKTAADNQLAYAELLVSSAMGVSGPVLTNAFSNGNLLKRRVTMLLCHDSPRCRIWRYGALIPVVAGMLLFSVACNQDGQIEMEQDVTSSQAGTDVLPWGPDVVFIETEVSPEPPGGMRAFMEYIGQNYEFPQEAIEAGVTGLLQVSFVIERDGSLTDMKIVRDLGYGTGAAAIRVLQSSSKWSPGVQNGRPVRVAYTLPIRLNLQQ